VAVSPTSEWTSIPVTYEDPYCDAALHSTWRPLLSELNLDYVDYTYRTPKRILQGLGHGAEATGATSRGSTGHLGISVHKIKDIIRRSDKNNDGIIFYADWIET
ncbi:Rhomboid-like protein, partial [Caligus rogercresseyi]